MQLVNIGFGNIVTADRIIAIVTPDSAPVKKLIQKSKEDGTQIIVDATYGRKTRAVLIMDSGHIILSAVSTDKIVSRIERNIIEEEFDDVITKSILEEEEEDSKVS